MAEEPFDPRETLAALEREYVAYVLIGGLARVLRGTDETTRGVDICPSLACGEPATPRARTHRLSLGIDRGALEPGREPVLAFATTVGAVNVVFEPAGTRSGYQDLRRAATREHLGHGLRPTVASVADLARMTAALGRDQDLHRLPELRRMLELEVDLQRGLGRER